MPAFKIVKRSDLPAKNTFNGRMPGAARVRLHRTGNLNFSKLAAEPFTDRSMAYVEYDEEVRSLRFTAVDKPLRGLAKDDHFEIRRHKASPGTTVIAMKRLLKYLGFEFTGKEALNFEIVSINLEQHSIAVVVPAALMPLQMPLQPEKRAEKLEPAGPQPQAAAG